MKPQAEEFLYFLMWVAEGAFKPGTSSSIESFEGWAWRNGLGRRLAQLERQRLIRSRPARDTSRVVRLTRAGRLAALGGRHPEESWGRQWDGRWRMVIFDVPVHQRPLRIRLWRLLRAARLGCLQGSAWISPDPLGKVCECLEGECVDPGSLMLMEVQPAGGERDHDMVCAAWNWNRINECYQCLRRHLGRRPGKLRDVPGWCRCEQALWRAAMVLDPLLPNVLCPAGYAGPEVWNLRRRVLAEIAGLVLG